MSSNQKSFLREKGIHALFFKTIIQSDKEIIVLLRPGGIVWKSV